MSYVFELALIASPPSVSPLRTIIADAVLSTGWGGYADEVTIFASRFNPDLILVEHRAVRSNDPKPINGLNPITHRLPRAYLRIAEFYVELGCRLATLGSRTLATVTSDQVGRWAIYALETSTLAHWVRPTGLKRLFASPRLPEDLFEEGELNSENGKPSRAASWLSTAITSMPPVGAVSDFHSKLIEYYEGATAAAWAQKLVLPPLRVIRNGALLTKPDEVSIEEALAGELPT